MLQNSFIFIFRATCIDTIWKQNIWKFLAEIKCITPHKALQCHYLVESLRVCIVTVQGGCTGHCILCFIHLSMFSSLGQGERKWLKYWHRLISNFSWSRIICMPTTRCQFSALRIVSSEIGWDWNIFSNIALAILTGDFKL